MPAVQRLGEWPADRLAGVVDQDVHTAKVLLDLGDQFVDGVEVRQIRCVGCRLAALSRDPIDELVQQLLTACDHDDGGAAAAELLRGRLADASRCAGQQDALALEVDGITAAL